MNDVEMNDASAASQREPTAEDYVAWMLERCMHRRSSAEDPDRRKIYNERVTILHGLRRAMLSEHASVRSAVMQTLATMPEISDDESSPNYASINAPVVNFSDVSVQ
eukprot:s485_g2.t1